MPSSVSSGTKAGMSFVGGPGNINLIRLLDGFKKALKATSGPVNSFKIMAYQRAIEALKGIPEVTSEADLVGIPGIGAGIGGKLRQYLTHGTIEELEKLRQDPQLRAMELLTGVMGIGPSVARKLVVSGGIASLEQLARAHQAGKVSLTARQQLGVQHYHDLKERMEHSEAARFAKAITKVIRGLDPRIEMAVAGSFRREKDKTAKAKEMGIRGFKPGTSGDVDVLLAIQGVSTTEAAIKGKYLSKISKALKEAGILTHGLSSASTKVEALARLPGGKMRRLDLRLVGTESWPTALLYFTGSAGFNEEQRREAKRKGMTLNEYGLFVISPSGDLGTRIPVSSEEDVFRKLGMKYRRPADRSV